MKTIKKFSVLIFCFIQIHLFSQNENMSGKVYYKKSFASNIENSKNNSFNKQLIDAFNRVYFVLYFNNNESTFQLEPRVKNESSSLYKIATVMGGGKGIYYTNINNKMSLQKRNAFGKDFIIENTINKLEWEILDKTKVIEGYTCYKAKAIKKLYVSENKFTTRVIEAWYTKEIPISHGPIGYNGLPGLILELKERNILYTMQKISYDHSLKIYKPNANHEITDLEFEIMADRVNKNKYTKSPR